MHPAPSAPGTVIRGLEPHNADGWERCVSEEEEEEEEEEGGGLVKVLWGFDPQWTVLWETCTHVSSLSSLHSL